MDTLTRESGGADMPMKWSAMAFVILAASRRGDREGGEGGKERMREGV
jgi:hypothetical protein